LPEGALRGILRFMKKPTVGVIFGSRSTEHDVSVITALAAIIAPLEVSQKYTVVPIYIAKDGRWYSDERLKDVALYSSGEIDGWLKKQSPVLLDVGKGLRLIRPGLRNRLVGLDVVFPALHGTHGEDGEVMGIFEMAGVPYVGCNVSASAVAMDKVLTKLVAQASDIPVTKFVHFAKHEFETDPDDWVTKINRKLHYPLFVKPAHLGSSIGITRVADPKDLRNAIEVALHYDIKALVEEGVQNLIEVTLPIMGNEEPRPALLERPATKPEEFFDFDTKYMSGGKRGGKKTGSGGVKGSQGYSTIPAKLPKELYAKAESTGLAVYRALGCSGMARVDMLIDSKTDTVYCNEVNPLPGSLYQHNWNRAGVSNVDLVTQLIDLALERHAKQAKLETTFATNFLKQF
jgi:D-alanine-D-alanine ligase